MIFRKARVETPLERALKPAFVGLVAGLAGGIGIALPIYLVGGANPELRPLLWALVLIFPLGGLAGGFLIGLVAQEGVGALVERALMGGRGRTPAQHSRIQALVARGAYLEAVQTCRQAVDRDPKDCEPLLLGARVLRDHLGRPREAAEWFRRALRSPVLRPETDISATRELVELYEGVLETPHRALPELARIMDRYPDTKAATWARNTLKQLKASTWSDLREGE